LETRTDRSNVPDIKIPTINVNKIVEDIKNAPPPPPIKLPPPVTIPKPKPLGKLPGIPNILDKVKEYIDKIKGFFSGFFVYFKYVGYVFIGLIVLFVLSKLAPILGLVLSLFRRG
jgi:hypothetical protein